MSSLINVIVNLETEFGATWISKDLRRQIVAALKAGQAMRDSLFVDQMYVDQDRWIGVEVKDKEAAYLASIKWDTLVQLKGEI